MNQVIQDQIARHGQSLYWPDSEHDACGVGFIAHQGGERSNRVLRYALNSLCNLAHRGAIDADAKTGDGAGVLTQIPYKLFAPEVHAARPHALRGEGSRRRHGLPAAR